MTRRNKGLLIVTGIVAIGIAVAAATFVQFRQETPGILPSSGQVRGTEVTVSSKLAGVARDVPIREGEVLEKGA